MAYEIHMSSTAPYGEGGLGYHLRFISEAAALSTGQQPHVYCLGDTKGEQFVTIRNAPPWMFFYHYSPIRWSPSIHVRTHQRDFDRIVQGHLPNKPIVFHSFPGCAERSFNKVHKYGGIAILEAATTHIEELYSQVTREHSCFHMGGNPFSERGMKQMLREYDLADYIVVSSTLQKESFLSRAYEPNKILLSPLGVDTERFSPNTDRYGTLIRQKGQKFRVIQVGQVSLLKGFQYVLEALKLLNDSEIELVLLGGIGWRGIRRLVDSYRRDGVQIHVTTGDPVPWLRGSHLCVHASIQDGFGLAPLEAMSCGLPVIVTDTTGMRDVIQDGKNGYVTNSRDVHQLATYIRFLKDNEDARINMGLQARTTALGYDLRLAQKAYARLLSKIWSEDMPTSARPWQEVL